MFRYQFPSEWKLEIIEDRGNDSNLIAKPFGNMGKCVLTNISTNYTGAGTLAAFGPFRGREDQTYSPFVNLELTFAETNLKHRKSESINPGGDGVGY